MKKSEEGNGQRVMKESSFPTTTATKAFKLAKHFQLRSEGNRNEGALFLFSRIKNQAIEENVLRTTKTAL
jgi:hypothetical protein